MSDILDAIESAIAEVPENVGKVLTMVGDEITKFGVLLQALAVRMDNIEKDHDA